MGLEKPFFREMHLSVAEACVAGDLASPKWGLKISFRSGAPAVHLTLEAGR